MDQCRGKAPLAGAPALAPEFPVAFPELLFPLKAPALALFNVPAPCGGKGPHYPQAPPRFFPEHHDTSRKVGMLRLTKAGQRRCQQG